MTRVRWWILGLIFVATTINYLDRIVFSVLATTIRVDLHLDTVQYGNLQAAFQFAYTAGFLVMGKVVDRYGTRFGYALAIVWWSIAAMAQAFTKNALWFGFWRAMLGLGESGNFPSAIRAVTEWFPAKDRAFATGIFNAGTNVASMIGPPIFAYAAMRYGWPACFLVTGASGLVWAVWWWWSYRRPERHRRVNEAERAYILEGRDEAGDRKIGWVEAAQFKQTWAFALGKAFSDPVWWFYLYWLPLYLVDVQKLTPTQMSWMLVIVYGMADMGSVLGGWLSGWLMRRGWSVERSRKTTLLICACCMPVASLAVLTPSLVAVVALVSLATSAHQAWSANLYTVTSDLFPKNAVASVVGIGGFLGGLSGAFFSALLPSRIVAHYGFTPAFLMMGIFHLLGWWVMTRLLPGYRKVTGRVEV